jgi:hypothetical protein
VSFTSQINKKWIAVSAAAIAGFGAATLFTVTHLAGSNAPTAMQTTKEQYFFYDRSPLEDPLCLNEDDSLAWLAAGSLDPGESYTFTPQHRSCQPRAAHGTFVFTGDRRRDHPQIQVTVTAECYGPCPPASATATDDGVQRTSIYDCGYTRTCWKGGWCLRYGADPDFTNTWTFTMTNIGTLPASNVYVFGRDDGDAVVGGYQECNA